MILMKNIATIILLLCSCNTTEKKEEQETNTLQPKNVIALDSTITKLKAVVLELEKQELSTVSFLKQIMIDSVQYKMISLPEYFETRKVNLKKIAHFSANKEKTEKAIAYLDAMILNSVAEKKIFEVQFHLNAVLSNNTVYNEHHVKYLYQNFSEVILVFPENSK